MPPRVRAKQDQHVSPEEVVTREHLPHLLMLLMPLGVFAALFVAEWRRTSERPVRPAVQPLVAMVAGLVAAAAVVHLAVTREHFEEAAVLGWFFLLLGLAQLAVAWVLLVRATPQLLAGTVVAHLGVVALWAWTRTVGVPLGVAGGHREAIGAVDLGATACEVGVVLVGLLVLARPSRAVPSPAGWLPRARRSRRLDRGRRLPSYETEAQPVGSMSTGR